MHFPMKVHHGSFPSWEAPAFSGEFMVYTVPPSDVHYPKNKRTFFSQFCPFNIVNRYFFFFFWGGGQFQFKSKRFTMYHFPLGRHLPLVSKKKNTIILSRWGTLELRVRWFFQFCPFNIVNQYFFSIFFFFFWRGGKFQFKSKVITVHKYSRLLILILSIKH